MATAADWGVAGQAHAVDALRRAIARGQLAHAYLLGGPPGVGKATLALRLAQALTCEAALPPCRECRRCRRVEAGESPDVERITVGGVCDESGHRDHAADGSTRIRICQVRRLERVASLAPFAGARRVFVIDAADDLQPEAAHALLKTLEEPPATVLLVLLAADAEALLPTVRSRCQQLTLRPLPVAQLAAALRERDGMAADEALELARRARGRYGLALRMRDDPSLAVLRKRAIDDARRLAGAGRNERLDYSDRLSRAWRGERESVLATLDVWREWWRDALAASAGAAAVADVPACSPAQALRGLGAAQRAREHLLANVNPQLALDVMMLDLPVLAGAPGEQGEEGRQAALAPA